MRTDCTFRQIHLTHIHQKKTEVKGGGAKNSQWCIYLMIKQKKGNYLLDRRPKISRISSNSKKKNTFIKINFYIFI